MLREIPTVHWTGTDRPALTGQGMYPRPVQNPLPVWLGSWWPTRILRSPFHAVE
jgi:hypothetical protein